MSVRLNLSLVELCCCLIRDSEQTQTCVNAGTLGLIVLCPAWAGFGFLRNVWPSHVGDKELHCIDQTQLMDAGFSPGDLLSPHCRAAEGLQSRDLCSSGTQPWPPASSHGICHNIISGWVCLICKCSAWCLEQSWGLFLVCQSWMSSSSYTFSMHPWDCHVLDEGEGSGPCPAQQGEDVGSERPEVAQPSCVEQGVFLSGQTRCHRGVYLKNK